MASCPETRPGHATFESVHQISETRRPSNVGGRRPPQYCSPRPVFAAKTAWAEFSVTTGFLFGS